MFVMDKNEEFPSMTLSTLVSILKLWHVKVHIGFVLISFFLYQKRETITSPLHPITSFLIWQSDGDPTGIWKTYFCRRR